MLASFQVDIRVYRTIEIPDEFEEAVCNDIDDYVNEHFVTDVTIRDAIIGEDYDIEDYHWWIRK